MGSEASLFSFSLWSTKISLRKEFSYVFSSYRPYVSPFVPPPLTNVQKPFSQILEQCPLLSTFWTHSTISFKICKLANPKHSTARSTFHFQSTNGTKLQFFVVKPPLNSSNSLGLVGRLAHFEFCGIRLRSIICSDRCSFVPGTPFLAGGVLSPGSLFRALQLVSFLFAFGLYATRELLIYPFPPWLLPDKSEDYVYRKFSQPTYQA